MNRKTNTPLGQLKTMQVNSGLSGLEIKRLMAAHILGGMCANPRNFKFEEDVLASQAINLAEQIIERTS